MQPLKANSNQACKLLSITRDTLRNLSKKDSTFPKPYKYGTAKQSTVYFDYAEVVAWHELQKQKALVVESELYAS